MSINNYLQSVIIQACKKKRCNVFNVNKKYNNRVLSSEYCSSLVPLLIAPKHAGAVTRVWQAVRNLILDIYV